MIRIFPDYETAERSGAEGMFQIYSVVKIDEYDNETNLTEKINQGKFYRTGKEVLEDLGLNPKTTDFELV